MFTFGTHECLSYGKTEYKLQHRIRIRNTHTHSYSHVERDRDSERMRFVQSVNAELPFSLSLSLSLALTSSVHYSKIIRCVKAICETPCSQYFIQSYACTIQSSNTDSMELEECQHNKEYIICGATTQQSN